MKRRVITIVLAVLVLILLFVPCSFTLFTSEQTLTQPSGCTLREHNQGASLIPIELSAEQAADVGQTLRDMTLHFRGLTRRITSEPPATLYELSLWHEDDQTFTVWVDRKHLYLPLRAGFFVCFSPASGTDTLFSALSRLHAAA